MSIMYVYNYNIVHYDITFLSLICILIYVILKFS